MASCAGVNCVSGCDASGFALKISSNFSASVMVDDAFKVVGAVLQPSSQYCLNFSIKARFTELFGDSFDVAGVHFPHLGLPKRNDGRNAQAGVCEHFAQGVARLAGGHDVIH